MSQSVSSRAASHQAASSQAGSSQAASGQAACAPGRSVTVALDESERAVLEALRDIRYGEVEVVVHGSRIVQITRTQKLRVDGR